MKKTFLTFVFSIIFFSMTTLIHAGNFNIGNEDYTDIKYYSVVNEMIESKLYIINNDLEESLYLSIDVNSFDTENYETLLPDQFVFSFNEIVLGPGESDSIDFTFDGSSLKENVKYIALIQASEDPSKLEESDGETSININTALGLRFIVDNTDEVIEASTESDEISTDDSDEMSTDDSDEISTDESDEISTDDSAGNTLDEFMSFLKNNLELVLIILLFLLFLDMRTKLSGNSKKSKYKSKKK